VCFVTTFTCLRLYKYLHNHEVIEIPNADHSYRDTVSEDPPPYAFQEDAIVKAYEKCNYLTPQSQSHKIF